MFVFAASRGEAGATQLTAGSGSFDFRFFSADAIRRITVWYHRPADVLPDAPVVFVMHGAERNAANYRKYWIPFAEARRFILLVPEFSRAQFGGNYNLERMVRVDGSPVPKQEWPYAAIENIFDAVRSANALTAQTYDIYGHSAGGQFVHRLALLLPTARYRTAVVANAGWYTMPDPAVAYPYGLAGTEVTQGQLAKVLSRRLVVLLGDRDIDPDHASLRRTPEAMTQGENRYLRGHAFFKRAQRAAAELRVPFEWKLHIAPGVAHSNARVAPHAAPFVGGRD